jgi:hypothetical protein
MMKFIIMLAVALGITFGIHTQVRAAATWGCIKTNTCKPNPQPAPKPTQDQIDNKNVG